jgi:2-amino-4-hydroxy-6-hydroxymethyldihydropteridine diphosphokinase
MCFFVLGPEPVNIVNTKVLKVLLLLGSNSEDAIKVLAEAGRALSAKTPILRAGSLWRTAAWGFEGPDFINQVLEVEWTGEPIALLEFCLETERLLGRVRSADAPRYESRRIDIDLLLASPFLTLAAPRLQLPHPRMAQRRFVLQPLAEYWSDWIADESGRPVSELLSACSDRNFVHLVSDLN